MRCSICNAVRLSGWLPFLVQLEYKVNICIDHLHS